MIELNYFLEISRLVGITASFAGVLCLITWVYKLFFKNDVDRIFIHRTILWNMLLIFVGECLSGFAFIGFIFLNLLPMVL